MEGVPAAPTHPTAATNESFIFHISCHTPGNGERRRDKNVATARGQPQGDNAAAPAALPALSFSPPTFHQFAAHPQQPTDPTLVSHFPPNLPRSPLKHSRAPGRN